MLASRDSKIISSWVREFWRLGEYNEMGWGREGTERNAQGLVEGDRPHRH
jgi:hypothetical protein